MSKISFTVGEIIWAKIRGYPWWPAIITGTEDEQREKKYAVSFIGDNTHASLAKKSLDKFEKGLNQHSNTKKKNLQESIQKAKEIYYNRNGNRENLINSMIKNNEKYKKEKDSEKEKEKQNQNKNNNNNKEKNIDQSFNKKKIKKLEDKTENELIYKISNYLKHITAIMLKKEINFNFEKNKENLCKIFKYLEEYKIQEPIEFLKKSNLGKYIKFINDNVENEEIKQATEDVYKNLESQVLSQLLNQK